MDTKNTYIIIVDKSAGNETVGEMWQETYMFDGSNSLDDVMKEILPSCGTDAFSKQKITITKPHNLVGDLK